MNGNRESSGALPKRVTRARPRAVDRIMRIMAREIAGMELPAVEKISEAQAENPFQILIATLLSARTQDATTHAASTRLFKRAHTPGTLAKLPVETIERLIFPVGFYRTKARHVKKCCEKLVTDFNGQVPSSRAGQLTESSTVRPMGRRPSVVKRMPPLPMFSVFPAPVVTTLPWSIL